MKINKMKREHWIGIIDNSNFEILLKNNIFGLKDGFQKRIKNLDLGDLIVFYILGKEIAGIFEVMSRPYETNNEVFGKFLYPIRFDIKKYGTLKRKPFEDSLIKNLLFIKNKQKWGGHFQGKAIINIEKDDFNKIRRYLEK